MALTIELPKELGQQLARWAEMTQQSEEEIVCRALESYLAVPLELREELEAWQQLGAEAIERVAPSAHEAW